MSNPNHLRSLNVQTANWFPISWGVGRDPVLADIEDGEQVLPALGLHVCGAALCLAKDDEWLNRYEIMRIGIPWKRESKTSAAQSLCKVNLWREEDCAGVIVD